MNELEQIYQEELAAAPILIRLRKEMANDSRHQLKQFLERVIDGECEKQKSNLPIVDAILQHYSAAEIRSLYRSYMGGQS